MLVNQEAIRQALAFCIGEGITVYWDGEPEMPMYTVPYTVGVGPAGACYVVVKLGQAIQVGGDDFRNDFNETSELVEMTVSGNRLATLSLRVESNSREESTETTERVRTRLRFRAPREILKAANISIASIEATQNVDYSWDNRDISACVLDIRLNIGSNDRDEDVTYIETVNTTDVVSGPARPRVTTAVDMSGTVAINGTGYELGALVVIDGQTYTPAMVEPTLILVSAPLPPGTYTVTVINPTLQTSGSTGSGKLTVA